MSDSSRVKTALINGAYCSVIPIMFLSALGGVWGADVQDLAWAYGLILVVSCFTFVVGFVILVSDQLFARIFYGHREVLSAEVGDRTSVGGVDTVAQRLRSNLELMQRDEDACAERYSQRRCCVEDVARAKALRLQAEIELIRHERRPKTWAEACAEYPSRQR